MAAGEIAPISGEFSCPAREAAFRRERLAETLRHTRRVFLLSALLNLLFLATDWRFLGQDHFFVAITGRSLVIAAAVGAALLATRVRDIRHAEWLMAGWMALTAAGVTALVNSHSAIALVVVLLLPAIYYLAIPAAFRTTCVAGAGTSVALALSYLLARPIDHTALGLMFAALTLNCSMVLVVARSNRLRRLEWAATQNERRLREELGASRTLFETMFMLSPVPLIVAGRDDGRLIKANDAGVTHLGQAGARSTIAAYVDPADRARLKAAVDKGGAHNFELRVRRADGQERDLLVNASAIVVGGRDAIMSAIVDITERKALEARLAHLASTDSLTGLPNRSRFFELAEAEVWRSARLRRPLAVLMADMDHFKRINDELGHEAGDRALRAFGDVCRAVLGDHDIAGRLGGEEFAMLLPNTAPAAAHAVAERLRAGLAAAALTDWPAARAVTASIGIAAVEPGESTVDPALSRADRALYDAKNGGRNRVAHAMTVRRRAVG